MSVLPFHMPRKGITGNQGAVSSATFFATKAGLDILARGGNAVDAAVAVSLVLAVTEPYHSGIGGGCFALIHDNKTGRTAAVDARGVAPQGAPQDLFVKDGTVQAEWMLYGGRSVAVPGLVKALELMRQKFGSMPFKKLAQAAIAYAREGFPAGTVIAGMGKQPIVREKLQRFAGLAKIYNPEDRPVKEGQIIKQEQLADTIELIAEKGAAAFYTGSIAQEIVKAVAETGGILSQEDLASYTPRLLDPVKGQYKGYTVLSMSPPSSGGTHLIQMLKILKNFDLKGLGFNSAAAIHALAETMKIAFADRSVAMGDPAFVKVPVEKIVSESYACERCRQIDPVQAQEYGPAAGLTAVSHQGGTTHFSVMDRFGNAVAMTQTIRDWYGSGVVAGDTGIVLNNIMADASPMAGVATTQGLAYGAANAIAGGKTPLSSKTPTIILKDNLPLLAIGAAGGPRIITTTLQVILNVIEFNLPLSEAIRAPRIHCQGQGLELERGISGDTIELLRQKGHRILEIPADEYLLSWANGVMRQGEKFYAGAESRIEGAAGVLAAGVSCYEGVNFS